MKTKVLIFLLVTAVCVSACGQTSLSGRYVTDDEDTIYQYFDFSANGTVRMGIEILGYETTVRAKYKIEDGYVVITSSDGDEIELEIIDANTLEGDSFGVYGTFIKQGRGN